MSLLLAGGTQAQLFGLEDTVVADYSIMAKVSQQQVCVDGQCYFPQGGLVPSISVPSVPVAYVAPVIQESVVVDSPQPVASSCCQPQQTYIQVQGNCCQPQQTYVQMQGNCCQPQMERATIATPNRFVQRKWWAGKHFGRRAPMRFRGNSQVAPMGFNNNPINMNYGASNTQSRANSMASSHNLRHFGGQLTPGASVEGWGFSTVSGQDAVQRACYYGQRQIVSSSVSRGSNGWYAVNHYR